MGQKLRPLSNLKDQRAFRISKSASANHVVLFYKPYHDQSYEWMGYKESTTFGKKNIFFIIYHTGIQLFRYIGIPQGRPDIIPPFALDDQSFIDLPAFYKTFTWPASKKWWMDYIRDRPLPSITLSEVFELYIFNTERKWRKIFGWLKN